MGEGRRRRRVLVIPDPLAWLAGSGLLVFGLAFAFWVGVSYQTLRETQDAILTLQKRQGVMQLEQKRQGEELAEHRTALRIGGLMERPAPTPGR